MGTCQSCLGRRDKDIIQESEDSRLLYDDGHGMSYGSFNYHNMGSDDTVEAQHEHEALQRVVAKTSNNMVDVFEIGPRGSDQMATATPFAYAGQGARVARYQHLVSKLSAAEDENTTHGVKVDWLTDEEDNQEMQSNRAASISIKALEDEYNGPLVGTFADAAEAMK